jgi:protein transport protein SEC24
MQPPLRMPGIPGSMQPNTLGPPGTPTIPYSPHAGTQVSTPSKIDPNQIPRPMRESSVIIYETRQGGQATIPPVCLKAWCPFSFIFRCMLNLFLPLIKE